MSQPTCRDLATSLVGRWPSVIPTGASPNGFVAGNEPEFAESMDLRLGSTVMEESRFQWPRLSDGHGAEGRRRARRKPLSV